MAESTGMKNLKSRRLYLQVYDEIKSYIEKNHLLPGDKLQALTERNESRGCRFTIFQLLKRQPLNITKSLFPFSFCQRQIKACQ